MAKLRRISKMSNSFDKQKSDWVKGLNYREVVFALYKIKLWFHTSLILKPDNDYLLEFLNKHIEYEADFYDLRTEVELDLVSNEWIDWVLQSNRHKLWFANQRWELNKFYNFQTDISPDYFKNLIYNIDLERKKDYRGRLSFDVDIKTRKYSSLKLRYEKSLEYLQYFNWIKKDDENLLNWCFDYLNHKQLLLKHGLIYPDNLADKYDVIMVSIQFNWNCLESIEHQPLKEKMHKAWTQKKMAR